MQQSVALSICILFILYLLRLDFKTKPNVSIALWIPLIWFLIISSRMISQWFELNPEDFVEGNPIDPKVFSALMVVGLFILFKRRLAWADILKRNALVFIYFAYFGLSIFWSDFPDITFKRYIKALGSIIMILVILTEPAPVEAIKTMIRRSAYMLIPLSIILYKYYPHLGRVYHRWTGGLTITGVTTNKNSLGVLCMVSCLILIFDLFSTWRDKNASTNKKSVFSLFMIFFMGLWLLIQVNSATSLLCFIIGICILIGMQLPIIKRNLKFVGYYIFFIICIFMTLQFGLDLSQTVFSTLGRDDTLTGRTDIWKLAIGLVTNPLIGTGFESFWLGHRSLFFADKFWFQMNEAHSGYVEIYLQGGLIGLFLLIVIIVNAYKNISNELLSNYEYGKLLMLLFLVTLVHNITESSFRPLQLMGFIFFLTAMVRPQYITVSDQSMNAANSTTKLY